MKFTANRSYEGKDIEVTKITSKSSNLTNKQMLEKILKKLDQYDQLFREHGWIE